MKHVKLKPCAECGGEGELRVDPRDELMHYVVCRDCGMRTLYYESEERAVWVWNWRSENDNEEADA